VTKPKIGPSWKFWKLRWIFRMLDKGRWIIKARRSTK